MCFELKIEIVCVGYPNPKGKERRLKNEWISFEDVGKIIGGLTTIRINSKSVIVILQFF
jgi:hypothetical protein